MARNDRKEAIELEGFLPYQVTLLADRIARKTTAIAKAHDGIKLSHWRVLAAIAEKPGRSAQEVVAVTPMDKGIVSRAVRSLIELRLVERKASQQDGRVAHLHLTAKGAKRYRGIADEVQIFTEELQADLNSNERRVLISALGKLIDSSAADS